MISKQPIALALIAALAASTAAAQRPAAAFDRGSSLQAWQDPGLPAVLAECSEAPAPFSLGGGGGGEDAGANVEPPAPALPVATAIPGVIAGGQQWEVVWAWEGNNADGIIAGPDGTMLFANNDASNVMQLDPATGLARIIHDDVNTGGALSRNTQGELFLASRGLGAAIIQLEPERRVFADSYRGDPLECIGGVINDLMAASDGSVYITITGGGLFHADPNGVVTEYGEGLGGTNGIVLSPDESVLYVTNGPAIVAFDVADDGSLSGQREFGRLRGGGGGDGSAVDQEGRLYVSTGQSADVFAPDGEFLGSIPGPAGLHGVAFGGPDKRTLYGIVFYGDWGTPRARNQVVAIPMLARGFTGRAK